MANCRCTRSWGSASGIDGKLGVFATQGADHTPCDQRLPGKIKRPDQPQRHAPGQDPAPAGNEEQAAGKEQQRPEKSEDRRVGKEGGRTCRSRGSPDTKKKKN